MTIRFCSRSVRPSRFAAAACAFVLALGFSAVPGSGVALDLIGTVTTITSVSPEPSVVGEPVTVQYTVVPNEGSGTPTGTVTVTDGVNSCTGTVAGGQCQITFTSAGAVNLTATYSGDADYSGSVSDPVPHETLPAGTVTTILSDQPDPSAVGEVVTIVYSVAVSPPGSGIPTGTVTVTDGTISCTGTVAGGQCSLTFTSEGARTLFATYSGDSNFLPSTSAGEPHQVGAQATTTTITADNPDPSVVGQPVTVQYTVVPTQGGGTPTGTVTVTDGVESCTGTVAGGQCEITFTSAGGKTLIATYSGDGTYAPSTSEPEPHTVEPAATATLIVSDQPDPSGVGQPVVVQYTVTVDAPGGGIPTGSVTVTDGVDSCTGTVASGQCTVTLSTAGLRNLTATYSGDSNFNGSTSPVEPHTVSGGTPTQKSSWGRIKSTYR